MQNRYKRSSIAVAVIGIIGYLFLVPYGFDYMDSGRLLAFFAFPNESLSFGTFLTIQAGRAVYALSGTHQLLILNLLGGILFLLEGLMVYDLLSPHLNPLLLTISILCGVYANKFEDILDYNKWTIFFFIFQIYLLVKSIRHDKPVFTVIAGFVCAVNIGFRLPNVLQVGMVLGICWYMLFRKGTKAAFLTAFTYLAGFGCGLIFLLLLFFAFSGSMDITKELAHYFELGSSDVGSYGPMTMLAKMFKGFFIGFKSVTKCSVFFLAGYLLLLLLFRFVRLPRTAVHWILFAYSLCMGGFIFAYYFRLEETAYLNIFAFFCICLSLLGAFFFAGKNLDLSTLCVFAVGMILTVTLGSNNGYLNFKMGMTYTLPATVMAAAQLISHLPDSVKALKRCALFFSLACGIAMTGWCCYHFYGYEYEVSGSSLVWDSNASLNDLGVPSLSGMKTTPDRKAIYQEFLADTQQCTEGSMIIFGNFPLGHVLAGKPSAISETWPGLRSFSTEVMSERLEELNGTGAAPAVVVFLPTTEEEQFVEACLPEYEEKISILNSYLVKNHYTLTKNSENFEIYQKKEYN